MVSISLDEAIERARRLGGSSARRILGIAGPPGAGKSTIAEAVVATLGPAAAVCVPMDGYHLANRVLDALGRRDRKGAQDTFDAAGYAALLGRLRAADEPIVYAPAFRREIEEPIAGAIAVPREVPLVVTEGNYLLLWPELQGLLDEAWFIEVDDGARVDRLVARHVGFGKSPSDARAWVLRSDEANARLVATTRSGADVIVRGA